MTQIRVREDWGPRVVVRGKDGKEEILWGKYLKCCIDNPHPVGGEPYDAHAHNKWNREKLRKVKEGTTLVQHLVKPVEVAPAGCTPGSSTAVWRSAKVLRVIRSGSYQDVLYSVQACRCIHKHSVKLTKRMLKRARQDNRLWGGGCRAPVSFTERHIVSPDTYRHLRDWIFSTNFLEPLKATEQATQRGHCFAVREAVESTFPRYKLSAQAAHVEGVSERVYKRVLGQKIFTKYRKDHCMCTKCLRCGWRGIWENGTKLIKKIDACPNWEVETNDDGKQTRHVPGTHLTPRLKRLWDFIRLQMHLHVEPTSDIGAHCLNLKLGSLAEERFNNCCDHHNISSPPPPEPEISELCCGDGCSKRSKHHCTYCSTSFCKDHLVDSICTAEHLPKKFPGSFVCPECSPRVESKTHKAGGCATCDEVSDERPYYPCVYHNYNPSLIQVHHFKLDIMKVSRATCDKDIIGRAEDLCQSIDIMVAHSARIVNQERYWPDVLDKMRRSKEFDHVLLKSDYWKKFEGTVLKQSKCKTAPKQSVETHSAW